MRFENKILRDLEAGQSTASSMDDKLELTPGTSLAYLKRMEKDGLVQSKPLGGILTGTPVFFLPRHEPQP